MLCRYKELAQQIFQEDDVRSVPETYGDRAVGLTRYDNFEELRRSGEVRQQNVLRVRRQRLRQGEVTKNRENIVFRRRERSFHPSAAELQQRVSLEEVPCDAGAQRDSALETIGDDLRKFARRRDVGIQHQKHTTLVFTCEFAHHQRAETRGRFPMDMARAVGWHIVAQSVEVLTAALCQAFHGALKPGENLEKFPRGRHRGVDEGFGAQLDAMRLLQEAKREARDDAKGILAINAAGWKRDGNGLLHAAALRQIGKIDGRFKERSGGRVLGGYRFHAKGKRRQRQLFVFQFNGGANRLAGENVLRQLQAHGHAGKRDRRENSGHENDGDKAGEDQKEKVVAGVEGGERNQNDSENVEPAFARDFVLHFVAQPAQRRAAGQNRDESDANPAGHEQRGERGNAGEAEASEFGSRAGVKREDQRNRECRHREEERTDSRAVGLGPEVREG